MEFTATELDGKVTCVRLAGRLDSAGADRIELPLTANVVSAGRDALIDLSDVTFIASMGIRLLVTAARGLNRKGAKMVLVGPQGPVREVLHEVALERTIPIVGTEQEALQRLRL